MTMNGILNHMIYGKNTNVIRMYLQIVELSREYPIYY